MKINVEKSVKRYLKRKVSITLGMLVAFLITGEANYSYTIDNTVTIKNTNGQLVAQTADGTNVGNIEEKYGFYTWINSKIIKVMQGNGVEIDESAKDVSMDNLGIITGNNNNSDNSGNGIFNKSSVGLLTSDGIIAGNSLSGNNSGNGIFNSINTSIGKITNNGLLMGNSSSGNNSGNGIHSLNSILSLSNVGLISGNYTGSSNENSSGNGVLGKSGYLDNSGLIIGNNGSGVALNNAYSFINQGVTIGKTSNGVSGNVGYLSNNGVIIGENGSGVAGTINSSDNYGVIIGENGSGVNEISNSNNSFLTNYGIVAGKTQAIGTNTNGVTNHGLLISNSGTTISAGENGEINYLGKYVINGVNTSGDNVQATNINSSQLKDKIIGDNTINYFDGEYYNNLIINVVGDENSSLNIDENLVILNTAINGNKNAVVFKDGNNKFHGESIIINGGENAFVGSDGNDEIYLGQLVSTTSVNSIINGNISLGKGEDTLNVQKGTTINGNIDMGEGYDTIKLSSTILNGNILASNDTITSNDTKLNGDLNLTNSSLALDSSTLNGEVSAQNGNINSNYSDINGNLNLTNNKLNLNGSILNGNIVANGGSIKISGSNNLFNTGATVINGDITLTDGEIFLGNNAVIDGDITLNGETTTVWVDKNQTLNGKVTVTATNKNLGLSYNINNENDLASMKTQLNKFNGFDNVKLANGGNSNVDLSEINSLLGISGGNGSDTFIIGESGTNIKISDLTEGDNDTLKLSFNTTSSTKLNGGYEGIENLELSSTGNNILDVSGLNFSSIKGGDGNDIFNGVSSEQLTIINGGIGEDTISMGSSLTTDSQTLDKVFIDNEIENLILANGENNLSLSDLTYLDKINFINGTNLVTLGTSSSNTQFNFNETKINGNVTFDLQNNIANLGSSTLSETTISLNNNFINNGTVGFNNGEVRFELGKEIYFTDGSKTSYNLNLGNINLGENAKLSPYAFLNVSNTNDKLTVKSWSELGGTTSAKEIIYEDLLKDYNTAGKEAITNAFNTWNSATIVDLVENGEIIDENKDIGNDSQFDETLVVNGNLSLNGNSGDINVGFEKGVSTDKFIITGNGVSNNNEITFNGSTTIAGGIDAKEFDKDINLNFNQNGDNTINLGGIAFGNTTGNTIKIGDASTVENIGNITTEGNGKANISISNIGDTSDGFNKILVGANAGNTSVNVENTVNELEINSDYKGTISFGNGNNNFTVNSNIGHIVTGKGNDEITLNGEAGIVDTGAGNDTVTVGVDKDITVNINGGEGNNIFNIGSSNTTLAMEDSNPYDNYKTLSGSLTGFGNINVNKDVKFDSGLKLDGTNTITIGSGNNLVLGVDYNKVTDGKVTGHALFDKGITVDNNNGNIVLEGTSELNTNTVVSMGSTNASTIKNGENIFISNSLNHDIYYDEVNDEIQINVKENLELGKNEAIKYAHLNAIYKSIFDANKIGQMSASSTLKDKNADEATQAQLEFYGKIYSTSPYAYSNDISRESAKTINNNVLDSRFKAEKGEWIHYGAIIGQGQDTDYSYNGAGHYKVDIGTMNVNVDSNVYGAYYMGEYGETEKLSLGYVVAGNKSDAKIGESSLDGNGFYLGAYAKYNVNKIDLIAGFGYQHNNYDADRKVSNKYQSMSTSEKYGDNTLTAYAGAKYTHQLREDVTFEPYARLNLTHVMQDSISEQDKGDLSISVDSQNFTAVDTELGFNFVKTMAVEKGKVNLFAGMGAEFSVRGYDTDYLTARINGASKSFEIISDENDRVKGKVSIGAEFEQVNGVFYNAKGTLMKSDNTDDYNFEIGIGYRF